MTSAHRWTAAGLLALLVVLALGELAGSLSVITLFPVGPLIAAAGARPRAVAGVAVLALVLTGVELARQSEMLDDQDAVRLATVLAICVLSVVVASLRDRLERRTLQAAETAAMLDVIFAGSPVGLGFHDLEGRFVRVNDRLAQINGLPPEDHLGRTLAELLPELPEVHERVRRVAAGGRPETEIELRGETPAEPGVQREWVASYWPVRSDGAAIGVGTVVFDVTDRRAAERAVRVQTDRYETLLTALSEVGEGMVVLEDGRCVYANPAFEQLSGYTFPELTALESVFELIVPEARDEARTRARRRVEEDVVDTTYQVEMHRRDGGIVLLELAGVPLEIAGPPARQQLVIVARDATARRRAEAERERLLARSALLAEAGALFDRTLGEERILHGVAELCVRDLADTCVTLLGTFPGAARRAAAVAREPSREAETRKMLDGAEDLVAEVVLTGAAATLERDAGVLVVVPLSARGRALGALAAGFAELPAPRRAETVEVLEELGRRAALALDSARLYEERSAVAHTLQRALLPPDLPRIPGAQVAARYLAAGEGIDVGGDFYDCFATGGGDWALVIGDVCGKGAEAAAVTAIARYTLRASVLHSRRPRAVLVELNEALLRQDMDYRFCTALYASVTPREGGAEVMLATGGHPLPLVLRADGTVETAGAPGTLLGVVPEPEISEERLLLAPGDSLVLYTDGVVEASPSDAALAPERLAALLRAVAGRDAGGIAESVEHAALAVQDGRLRDDVAVVVARVHGDGPAPFASRTVGVAGRA